LINVVCDRALLGAYVQGKESIDKETLTKASLEIYGGSGMQRDKMRLLRWVAASLVVVGCGAAIAISFYSHRIQSAEKTGEAPIAASTGRESGRPGMLQWPSGQPIELSREMAYQALFKEWNISFTAQKSGNICKQVTVKDVRCLDGSITLKALLNLNRPAVLKLFDDKGKAFYVTLKGIEGQNAFLAIGKETKTVDFREIEKRWLGDYLLLWKAPENFKGIIRPGDRGPQIAWLERSLSSPENGKTQQRSSFLYDADLVKRVKRFQLGEGVLPDGIVGPQTIIHLINRQGTKEPLLTAKNKGDK
jgi:general secretion pathway protein A